MAERTERQRDALRRLKVLLDDVDEQTRRPGEQPLRQAVAEQAREHLRRST